MKRSTLISSIGGAGALAAVIALGVAPTAFAGNASHVLYSSSVQIASSYTADLDTADGHYAGIGKDDVWFEKVNEKKALFNPIGTAGLVRMSSKPSSAACAHATYVYREYNIGKSVGRWFCVETTEDRYARVRLVSWTPSTLTIKFTTWKKATDYL